MFTGNGVAGLDFNGGTSPSVDKFRFVNNTIANNGESMSSLQLTNLYFDGSNTVANNNGNNYVPTTSGTFYNNMPTVSITALATATVGTPVDFSIAFADSSGLTATNYLWDLGDGVPVTSSTASFTYTETGTYNIGLVVWDSLGRAAHDQIVLTVSDGVGSSIAMDAAGATGMGSPVPEPSAAILTAVAGAAAAGFMARRRGRSRHDPVKLHPRR